MSDEHEIAALVNAELPGAAAVVDESSGLAVPRRRRPRPPRQRKIPAHLVGKQKPPHPPAPLWLQSAELVWHSSDPAHATRVDEAPPEAAAAAAVAEVEQISGADAPVVPLETDPPTPPGPYVPISRPETLPEAWERITSRPAETVTIGDSGLMVLTGSDALETWLNDDGTIYTADLVLGFAVIEYPGGDVTAILKLAPPQAATTSQHQEGQG
jgi:hypothetical protein